MTEWYETFVDQGIVPDFLLRFGIQQLSRFRLNAISHPTLEQAQNAKLSYIKSLREAPISLHTDKANEQHYEVFN